MDIKQIKVYKTFATYDSFTASEPITIEYNINAKDEYDALITTVKVFKVDTTPLSNLRNVGIISESTIQFNEMYELPAEPADPVPADPVPEEPTEEPTEENKDKPTEDLSGSLF